jgi:cell division initiation protein
MMTPQEAESRVFSKASFGGGYNMAQVDAFLDTLINDYSALYKENAALKSKMKVLVDKIEEYRATEDAMRRTLLSAQKMADSMVKEAEAKKTEAITKAEAEAKARMDEIQRELSNEEMRLTAARNSTTAYVNKLKELYTHELEYIGRLAEITLTPGENDPVKEIEEKVSEMLGAAPAEVGAETAVTQEEAPAVEEKTQAIQAVTEEAQAEEKPVDTSDTVVFDRLQFGKDYQFE